MSTPEYCFDIGAVEDTRSLFSVVLANLGEGLVITRTDNSRILSTNRMFDQMLGYSQGELTGKHISTINARTDISARLRAKEIITVLEEEGEWRGEIQNLRKNGSAIWMHASVSALKHPEVGSVWVAVHKDITERKRLEKDRLHGVAKIKALLRRVANVQESERLRISSDLHDVVGQQLGIMSVELECLRGELDPTSMELQTMFDRIAKAISNIDNSIRTTIANLRPHTLLEHGLHGALGELKKYTERSFDFRLNLEIRTLRRSLPDDVTIGLFRIAQEAVTNAVKHSRKNSARLLIHETQTSVLLVVEDVGVGLLDREETAHAVHNGWGIGIMKERAESMGGTTTVESSPGGVRVTVEIPHED